MTWEDDFRKRLDKFSKNFSSGENGIPISIKIRHSSGGCFHREHAQSAYRIIDNYLLSNPSKDYVFEEHESGPEIIVYLALATGGLCFAKSIIDLITTIIKARNEAHMVEEHRNSPLEIVMRGFDKNGKLREEISLKVTSDQDISEVLIEKALLKSAIKMFSESKYNNKIQNQ